MLNLLYWPRQATNMGFCSNAMHEIIMCIYINATFCAKYTYFIILHNFVFSVINLVPVVRPSNTYLHGQFKNCFIRVYTIKTFYIYFCQKRNKLVL